MQAVKDALIRSSRLWTNLRTAAGRGALAAICAWLVAALLLVLSPEPSVRVTLVMRTTTGEVGELFYAGVGEAISSERSVSFLLEKGWQTYRISVPARKGLTALRVDPGTEPGTVAFGALQVRAGTRSLSLIEHGRMEKVRASNALEHESSTDGVVRFNATAHDPYMEFEVPADFAKVHRPWSRVVAAGLVMGVAVVALSLLTSLWLPRAPAAADRLARLWVTLRERTDDVRWSWLAALLPPFAGLLWAKGHVLPSVMCASLTIALFTMMLAGAVAQRLLDGFRLGEPALTPGVFQLIWLGQYLVFAMALVLTPFMAVWTDLTGVRVPLQYSLPLLVALAALVCARVPRQAPSRLSWPSPASAPLLGLVGLAIYRAMFLHSRHAGALGHDTQQHLYWVQHIVDSGYLTVTARDTELLDYYPKFFHLLTACWSSMGVTSIVGPFLKVLPALEVSLACGFFAELLCRLAASRPAAARIGGWMSVGLGAFLAWHLTSGDGQAIYDGNDLSGTPRLSSVWVLCGLPLLLLAHRIGTLRDARPWLWASVPVFPLIALGVNPVLVPVCATYTLPVTALLAWFTRERGTVRPAWSMKRALAFSVVASGFAACCNSFVLDKLMHTALGARVFARLGIRAAAAGLADPGVALVPPPICSEPLSDCLRRIAERALDEGATSYTNSVLHAEMAAFGSGRSAFGYWAVFAVPLVLLAAWTFLRRDPDSWPNRRGAQLFLAILGASALPSVLHPLLTAAFGALVGHGSMFLLLHGYYGALYMMLGSWVRCFLALSSWAFLPGFAAPRRALVSAWVTAALALLLVLTAFEIPALASHRYARWPWTIDWPELRAIRHLDAFVPDHETVVVPAYRISVSTQEQALMAPEPVGIVAPLLSARMLFFIRMSLSVDYNWPDLEWNFCADAERRDALLRKVNARWVLVRELDPRAKSVLDRDLWHCGVTLRTLGAEYPPAFSERDLALYRINP